MSAFEKRGRRIFSRKVGSERGEIAGEIDLEGEGFIIDDKDNAFNKFHGKRNRFSIALADMSSWSPGCFFA